MKSLLIGLSMIAFSWSCTSMAQSDIKPVENPASTSEAAATEKTSAVPRLNIKWECEGCVQNELVIPQINEAYEKLATENQKILSNQEIISASIFKYNQRPPASRALFGAFAGKDILGLKFSYKGVEIIAEDYFANAWQGMNALCESVANIALQKIIEISQPTP